VTRFRAGHAAGSDWRQAVDACLNDLMQASRTVAAQARRTNSSKTNPLGFLYITDVIAEQAGEILDRLRNETGVEHAGLVFEFTYAKVDGFGASDKLSVGDATFFGGINFEF
jgi:hypothetical protein